MAKKLYAGNLSFSTTEESLGGAFSQFGEVVSAVVIKDRVTGKSKGFGFVEFAEDSAADRAVTEMNGREFEGRRIRVSPAEEKKPRSDYGRGEGNSFRNGYGRRGE